MRWSDCNGGAGRGRGEHGGGHYPFGGAQPALEGDETRQDWGFIASGILSTTVQQDKLHMNVCK